MSTPTKQTVKLELDGENAARGIELDSLSRFIDKFRAALRDFERAASARDYQVGRGGHPDSRSIAATSFLLVGYKTGSAHLELEEGVLTVADEALDINAEGIATRNLWSLLDCIDAGEVDSVVVDNLDEARRALGENGVFKVKIPSRRRSGRIDAKAITRLRTTSCPSPTRKEVRVHGLLHMVATEKPRVEIRATDGYNWHCIYPEELGPKVIALLTKQVWAKGVGARERANRGSLELADIGALPIYEQSPLFSVELVPAQELERNQGVTGPQGLAALSLDDPPDADELDRYLAIMLED